MAAALLGAPPLSAQEGPHRPQVLRVPASASAMGLGNAFLLTDGLSDVLFYNPALLGQAGGGELAVGRYGSSSTLLTVSAAADWFSGGVGGGVQVLSHGTSALTPLGLSTVEDSLSTGGDTGVSELIATVGYARRWGPLRAGLAVKLAEERFGGGRDASVAADVGVAFVADGYTVGLAAQNLGPDLDLGGVSLPLPIRVTLAGATETAPLGPLDIAGSAALLWDSEEAWIPSAGLEISWWPVIGRTFKGRVGVRRVPDGEAWPVTFGAGFQGDDFGLDYAFQGFRGPPDGAHRLSVRIR